jgi:hypothetical protein
MILTKHACGHVGAEVGSRHPTSRKGGGAKAWVRWAETRGNPVNEDSRKCVDCK